MPKPGWFVALALLALCARAQDDDDDDGIHDDSAPGESVPPEGPDAAERTGPDAPRPARTPGKKPRWVEHKSGDGHASMKLPDDWGLRAAESPDRVLAFEVRLPGDPARSRFDARIYRCIPRSRTSTDASKPVRSCSPCIRP
jgi:hypothetical protein